MSKPTRPLNITEEQEDDIDILFVLVGVDYWIAVATILTYRKGKLLEHLEFLTDMEYPYPTWLDLIRGEGK